MMRQVVLAGLLAGAFKGAWALNAPDAAQPVSTGHVLNVPQPKSGLETALSPDHKTAAPAVVIHVANDEAQTLLDKFLPLKNQPGIETLDPEQIRFLAEDTPNQVENLLNTIGWFDNKTVVRHTATGQEVNVTLGKRVIIHDVNVLLSGAVAQDKRLPQFYTHAMEGWTAQIGEPFTQSQWSESKSSVLKALQRKSYPLAAIAQSKARLDPKTAQGDLSLTVDSKQPIFFGHINVTGSKRYAEQVARGLADFSYGGEYDLDKIIDYQQALEQDGHYASAVVHADFDHLQQDHVPILVEVDENKLHKLDLGLRVDSIDGPGATLGYSYYNLFNSGYIGSLAADGDRYQQNVSLGVSQPRHRNGYFYTGNVSFSNNTLDNIHTRALSAGIWRVRQRNDIDARLGVEYFIDQSNVYNGPSLGTSHALMLTYSWKHNNVQTPMRPANGYFVDAKVGATLGKLASSSFMQRVNVNAGYFYTNPNHKNYGTLAVRGQLGYVHAPENASVPQTLLFRTGGANSVRGYATDSIGIAGPSASILGGRVLEVASVEYQIPMKKDYAIAVFHDMGNVSDSFKDQHWRHSSGLGFRWYSPVAPLAFDIAYAHSIRKFGWSISLGTHF